jgi:predicted TIM-barrel fold metal-dependent hydrolase
MDESAGSRLPLAREIATPGGKHEMQIQSGLNRRRFLQVAGSAAAGSLIGSKAESFQETEDLLIIDCHAHIYGTDEKNYPTISKPYRPPAGKGTVAHLQQEMTASGVKHVTAVQTSTYYRFDNRFTVDSSRANNKFMVGICTLDPDDSNSPALLEQYANDYNVSGMRSIPAKSGRLDDAGVYKLWAKAEELGIVINALVRRDKRAEVEVLATRHPKLRVVIDHCLNLKAGPDLKGTLKEMLALAKIPNLHAKLTFIPTGTAEEYPCKDMHDSCHAVIEAFGPDRCIWGSDFPCELWCPKFSYAQNLRLFTHELGLDAAAKKAILGETANGLYLQRANQV